MLKIEKREPAWVELGGGARLYLKPITSLGMGSARAAAQAILANGGEPGEAGVAFTIALARWGALAWEGVGDDAGEAPELTPQGVQDLLEQHVDAYVAVDRLWVSPALADDQEKKGSSTLPAGTSRAGRKTMTSRKRPSVAATTA